MKQAPGNGERLSLHMPSPHQSREPSNSRRRSRRRKAYDLRILAADTDTGALWPGWVVDTSQGGLRLKLIGSVPPVGAVLKVHRFHTHKLDASLIVRIVHSKCLSHENSLWLAGCEFAEPPAQGVLVHFT